MAIRSSLHWPLVSKELTLKACFETSMRNLLHEIGYKPPQLPKDTGIENLVLEHFTQLAVLQGLGIEKVPVIAKVAVDMAHLVFPLHEQELRALLALYTGYVFVCDDFAPSLASELRNFRKNILTGTPNGPLLDGWVQLLGQIDNHYGPFSADMITCGTLEFVTAAVFECETDGKLRCHASAPNFPLYLRLKTGVAEPYIKMILPEALFPERQHLDLYLQVAPDLLEISVVVNDLLSFYKESIVSTERNNYVHKYAVACGVNIARALDEIAKRTVECIGNVRSVLSSEPKILRYVDSNIRGCVAVHGLPRYKLSEGNIPELLQRD